MKKKIRKVSEHTYAAHLEDGRVFILSNAMDGSIQGAVGRNFVLGNRRDWEVMPQTVGGYRIVPYGWNNNIPEFIRDTISDNNLAPGIIARQKGLIWGQGPQLFRMTYQKGQIVQEWTEDAEVQAWLDSWGYKQYILGIMDDFFHTGGYFDAKYLTRGSRISSTKKISHLENLRVSMSRLEWPEDDSRMIEACKHIIVGDFEHQCISTGVRVYPIFDPKNPGKYPAAATYRRLDTFGHSFYSVPQFWGAMRWIIRGSEIPTIFKYVTDNGINLAYHVHSSQAYWDYRREVLRNANPDWSDADIEKEIGKITKELLDSMTQVLTGKENAGKMFHSIDCTDDMGNVHPWKIEAVDQKIKDFVDSQLKIAEASVSAITSGMGLHPSLSNIMVNGKLASGSEMLYAFKLYLNSDTAIPTMLLMASINEALNINFPGKKLQMGFYHQSVKTEESISSGDRLKNQ